MTPVFAHDRFRCPKNGRSRRLHHLRDDGSGHRFASEHGEHRPDDCELKKIPSSPPERSSSGSEGLFLFFPHLAQDNPQTPRTLRADRPSLRTAPDNSPRQQILSYGEVRKGEETGRRTVDDGSTGRLLALRAKADSVAFCALRYARAMAGDNQPDNHWDVRGRVV